MFNQILGDESKKVTKWAAVSLLLLSVFLLTKTLSELKKLPNVGREVYPQSTITVFGEGEAYAISDVASFYFSVVEIGESAEAAQGPLDAKINKALAVLKEAEVEEKDIKTTSYNIYPKYEWRQQNCLQFVGAYCPPGINELIGFEVSQSITVKVRDVKKVGDLVNKIGAIGVSSLGGVEFMVDDREQYVSKAREEAISKAKAEAKVLAKQLGVRLGKVISFSENYDYPYSYDMGEMGGGGSDMVIPAVQRKAELPQGETKIKSKVSITYEIK